MAPWPGRFPQGFQRGQPVPGNLGSGFGLFRSYLVIRVSAEANPSPDSWKGSVGKTNQAGKGHLAGESRAGTAPLSKAGLSRGPAVAGCPRDGELCGVPGAEAAY